jgi:long-chain fatty acid transport protein
MRQPLLFLIPVFCGLTASASGFDTGPQGARVLGLGGASTAYINSIAGLSMNPGLLSQWGDSLTRLSFGGIGQVRRASFIGQDTYQRTDQELTVQPGGYFYATRGVGKRVALGLSLTTPYGYHTRWPGTWEGRAVIQESRLNTYFVQPTVAFKLNENFGAGVGFIYAYGKYSQRRALGLYGRTGDNLSFGISYRTGVNLKLKNGTSTYAGVPTRDAALLPASTGLGTQINLPNVVSVGIADRINKQLLLTFDFTLTGWSNLDSLKLDLAANGSQPARRASTPRRYEDAMTFRIGAEYQLQPKLTLLAGVRYDETPIRDEYINPEFIDASRLGVSAGLCYQLTRRLNLEGAYSFEYGQQRTARTNPISAQVANISGSYRLAVQTASLGVAMAF